MVKLLNEEVGFLPKCSEEVQFSDLQHVNAAEERNEMARKK